MVWPQTIPVRQIVIRIDNVWILVFKLKLD